jgi:hypothetical protein
LELEWSRELQRAEQEWYQSPSSDRPQHFDGVTKGQDPIFTLDPEPVVADPIFVPSSAIADFATAVPAESVPTPAPQAEIIVPQIEPQPEPVELALHESQDPQEEEQQRGFFLNGKKGLTGSPLEGSLEPTTLATATLTLVRGR